MTPSYGSLTQKSPARRPYRRVRVDCRVRGLEKDMDTLENAQKRAEYWKAESLAATKEIESLRAQVAELSDAFTVIWVSDDHAAWDGKAVEHFDALLAKVGGSDTATLNAE